MRASVGTDTEWASAAPDLDHFVVCAPAFFERFTSTGKIPNHPLLATDGAAVEEGSCCGGEDPSSGGGDDPRGSPGLQSLGERSPGAPPYSLGALTGGGAARGSRRVSMAAEKLVTDNKRNSATTSADNGVTGAGGSGSGGSGGSGGCGNADHECVENGAVSNSGNSGGIKYVAVVSPPRSRAKSAGPGAAGMGLRRSPGKARRRLYKNSVPGASTAEKGLTSSSLTPSRRPSV